MDLNSLSCGDAQIGDKDNDSLAENGKVRMNKAKCLRIRVVLW